MDDILPMFFNPNWFLFYVFWKGPSVMNEELFVNIFNGVTINTYNSFEKVYKFGDRYKEAKYKD